MSDSLGRPPLDLCLDLCGRRSIVDDDPKLIVVNEEPPCCPFPVRIEGNGLNCKITDVTPDDHADKAEQTTGDGIVVLGAVLHTRQRKHGPVARKA